MKTPDFYFSDHPLGNREKQISTRELANFLGVTGAILGALKRQQIGNDHRSP